MNGMNDAPALSKQAFERLPYYLQYLKTLSAQGAASVSAPLVAGHFGFTEVQVRKDFAAVSPSQGRPKSGFALQELITAIERALGYHERNSAVLAGVGSLGHALLSYGGFSEYGLRIAAAFDQNPGLAGAKINSVSIFPAEKISSLCRSMQAQIGIITVPAAQAQVVCDQFVAGGVKAIWNFAPIHLSVPEGILVQNENMAASLALLCRHLKDKLQSQEAEET